MLNVLIFYWKFCIDLFTCQSLLTPKYLSTVLNFYALSQPQTMPNNDYLSGTKSFHNSNFKTIILFSYLQPDSRNHKSKSIMTSIYQIGY